MISTVFLFVIFPLILQKRSFRVPQAISRREVKGKKNPLLPGIRGMKPG
jgi:hypothetical protein